MLRDPSWVKSRIYARLILRSYQNQMTPRDHRWVQRLKEDPGVTDRLIDQAMASLCVGRKFTYTQIVEHFHGPTHQLAHSRR
jgi:hypothetical protein